MQKFVRYVPAATGAHLVVTREKSRYEAEIVMTARRLRLIGKALAMDPVSAVEEAVERLGQQLRREHARRRDRRLRGARKDSSFLPAQAQVQESSDEVSARRRIVRVPVEAKPMSVEEAVLELEQEGKGFFVFRNARTREVNVLYQRQDGCYGWVEP